MIQKEGYLQAQGQLPIVINADIGDALADVLTVVDDGEGNLVASWQPPAAPAAHNHAASEITSGTIANDRLPATALTDDIPKSLIDAAGDIIYGSADNTPARLGKGDDGQYLKLVSGLPAWAAAAGGGVNTITIPIMSGEGSAALVDNTTYYCGYSARKLETTDGVHRIYTPAGTIIGAQLYLYTTNGAGGTITTYIRKNNTSDTTIQASTLAIPTYWGVTGLSIAMNGTTDYFEIKIVCGTLTTNPQSNSICGYVLMELS